MDKKQATQVLNQIVKELHEKGVVQVTPQSFESVAQAVKVVTEEKK